MPAGACAECDRQCWPGKTRRCPFCGSLQAAFAWVLSRPDARPFTGLPATEDCPATNCLAISPTETVSARGRHLKAPGAPAKNRPSTYVRFAEDLHDSSLCDIASNQDYLYVALQSNIQVLQRDVEMLATRSSQRFWAMLGLLALILGVVIVLGFIIRNQMTDVIKP